MEKATVKKRRNTKTGYLAFTKVGRPVEIARFYALLQATLIWRFEVFKIAWIKNCGDRSSFTSSLPISLPLDVSLPKASAPYRACRYDRCPAGPTRRSEERRVGKEERAEEW